MKFRSFIRSGIFRQYADLGVLTLASLAYIVICSLFLGSESSYFDEGFSSYMARFSPFEITHYTALDVHPPLYYIALHYWQQLVGIDVFSLRFMSVAWGVVALVFTFLFTRRAFGRKAAWSALLFVVLSPLIIRYSEAMRMYTMALAIVAAATYILILLHDPETKRRRLLWALYAVLMSAGMWTNYFTAFVWLAHMVWVSAGPRFKKTPDKRHMSLFVRRWYLALAAAIVLYLPWLPWLIVRFTDVQSTGFWIKPISVDTIISTVTTATVYKNAAVTTGWLAVLTCVYAAITIFVIIKAYRQASADKQRYLQLLILCAGVPIIGLIALSLPPLQSSYVYRYVISGVFMASILAGVSFALIKFTVSGTLKKASLYGLAIIVLGIGIITVKQAGNRSLDTGVKNMVAQAVAHIHQQGRPGTPIISRSPYTYYTASLYETKDFPVFYTFSNSLNKVGSTHMLYDHPEQRGIKNLEEFATLKKRVWILAEDRQSAMKPPANGWIRAQSFTLHDPVSGVPTAYGTEYVKP